MKKPYKNFNNKTLKERLQRLLINLFEYGGIWVIFSYVSLAWLILAIIGAGHGFSALLQFLTFWK